MTLFVGKDPKEGHGGRWLRQSQLRFLTLAISELYSYLATSAGRRNAAEPAEALRQAGRPARLRDAIQCDLWHSVSYIHLGSGGTKEDVQCKNHTPGLSATNRSVADPRGGIPTTSLRVGFACPSTMGGFSVGSEEV